MKISPQTLDHRLEVFRARCAEKGLSLTHQRWVIYRVLAGTTQHPTPEATYAKVRREIPSISLATIYKNIQTFLAAGLLREVSTPDETMRLDANLEAHHHLVCGRCGTILDLAGDSVAPLHLKGRLPRDFRVKSYNVSFLGYCGQCAPRVRASS
jgi:Fur family peroxide stress response transcriptional regulator